jgi:RNA polymerase sigma factor (sigma-70 family)
MNEHGLHALVLRARAGDRDAQGELITWTQPMLHQYARQLLGLNWDHRSSSDLVQMTWERALPRLPRFRGGADDDGTARALTAWLQTTLRRILLNQVRRGQLPGPVRSLDAHPADDSTVAAPEPAADTDPPSFNLKHADTRRAIAAALDRLPPLTRRIIELRLLEGRAMSEVAVELSRDEKTVRKYFHQGVQRLQRLLEDEA